MHGLVTPNENITLNLPKKAKAFLTSSFRAQEILEINNEKTRLWIEILNTSYTEELKITRNNILASGNKRGKRTWKKRNCQSG